MSSLSGLLVVVDRTMALFVGLGVGAIVTLSFAGREPAPIAPPTLPVSPVPAANAAQIPTLAARLRPQRSVQRASRLSAAVAEHRPVVIGVFGDSFGEGVWAGLYNQLRGDSAFEVRQFAERSTGFTRYRSLNVLEDIRAKLDRQPVDVAILSFGANDTQGIWDGQHGHAFMSEGWQRIVSERVDAVVSLLRARGAAVYWVGLPRMRDPAFDSDVQAMNRFYAARMTALRVPYTDTVPLTVDAAGRYAPYLPAQPGHARRMGRENDGIHMTIPGYIHLTEGLTDALRTSVAEARAELATQPDREDRQSGSPS